MMTKEELKQAYSNEIESLTNLGKFIEIFLDELLRENPTADFQFAKDIVKITPARVKDVDSFVMKALYRGKYYTDPMSEIEDKVGIRIIGYLQRSIDHITSLLESQTKFKCKPARLPKKESFETPFSFDYKSAHYILILLKDTKHGTSTIKKGAKVELQLRTFGQDFFGYLTHDTIYKSNGNYISNTTKRKIARVMALLETAQEIAMDTIETINEPKNQIHELFEYLQQCYTIKFGSPPKEVDANLYFLDQIQKLLIDINHSELTKIVDDVRLNTKINSRRTSEFLFQLPIVFLIYYFLRLKPYDFRELWPYTDDDLVPFLVDCGISQRD